MSSSDEKPKAMLATEELAAVEPLRYRDLDDGEFEIDTPREEFAQAVTRMLGFEDSGKLAIRFQDQALAVMKSVDGGPIKASDLNDVAALLSEIGPRDAVEGMLAVQMVGAHSAAMRCLMAASHDEQRAEGQDLNVSRAVKLMRVYTAQVEALTRHRNRAKQTVVVKHVHVHEGGQAIVGNVAHGEGGGGEQ